MRSYAEYDARKPSYHKVDGTDSFRHHRPAGAMKLLYEILEMLPSQHFTTISSYGTYAGFW